MTLKKNNQYFVSWTDVVLYEEADEKSEALNHLIMGDWLQYRGEKKNGFIKIFSRGNSGWIKEKSVGEERLLEVNFVDIGQGDGCHIVTPDDEVILIDAGMGDNMYRFLSWRYNLYDRDVKGVDGIAKNDPKAKDPFEIDYVVISHPDKDHYYGFKNLFLSRKVKIKNVFHNGIVERPIKKADHVPGLKYSDDLGGYVPIKRGLKYLWDVVDGSQNMTKLIKSHPTTGKDYIETLREVIKNNSKVKFGSLSKDDDHFDKFDSSKNLHIEVLAPVREKIQFNKKDKRVFRYLKNEGKTKNGHSIVFRLHHKKLKMILGGDLNTESQDYLVQRYTGTDINLSELEREVAHMKDNFSRLNQSEIAELQSKEAMVESLILQTRQYWEADIVKACHHGSHHFSESFLRILNMTATVISSGDNEGYSHPRPEALGSFGKYSRGIRPLIFSTELARSTREFTKLSPIIEDYLKATEELKNAKTKAEKDAAKRTLNRTKRKNVSVYGLITVRSDGDKVIIAQKLEAPSKKSKKWDIYHLQYNSEKKRFEYIPKH